MQKKMKLKGRVRHENGTLHFVSKMHDGTSFTMPVREHDVLLNDPITPEQQTVDAWLMVVQEAQQGSRVYLTLPAATLLYGRQVTVSEFDLMPLNATLAAFNPKKVESGASAVPPIGTKIKKKSEVSHS